MAFYEKAEEQRLKFKKREEEFVIEKGLICECGNPLAKFRRGKKVKCEKCRAREKANNQRLKNEPRTQDK